MKDSSDFRVFIGLDIGSSKVCAVAGQVDSSGDLRIIGVGLSPCKGIKRGVVVDIDDTTKSIKEAMFQVKQMSNMEISDVFINFALSNASLTDSKGVIAVSRDDREITENDVERVLQASKVIALPSDREIIDIIPQQFIVDGYNGIKDPVGMAGVRLEVESKIITASVTALENLKRSITRAGYNVRKVVLEPLAEKESVLTREDMEMGVCLVDVGASTTKISIFKSSHLTDIYNIPIGGDYITNDISQGLKVSYNEAEQLKIRYGMACQSLLDEDESIDLSSLGYANTKAVSRMDLVYIMEERIHEILELISDEVNPYSDILEAGVTITGGGLVTITGALDYSKEILNMPVKFLYPKYIGVSSPVYSAATGLVKYGIANTDPKNYIPAAKKNKQKKNSNHFNLIDKLKEILSDFL